ISEIVAADFMVNYDINVIGVLTDLNKVRQIFWLGDGKKINMVTLSHRKKALDIIGNMVSMKRVAGLTVQHIKVRDHVIISDDTNDDIAPMEDFYEEMSEEDILRHKMSKAIAIIKNNPLFSDVFSDSLIK
ncbi:6200_t:CDS:2, partial [Funneliformis geosporum]